MPKFKITVEMSLVGCTKTSVVEFDDAEWAEWTEEQREEALTEAREQAVWECIDVWSEEITDDE